MIIFLYGGDTFRSRRHLKKLIERFKEERDPGGYNVNQISCEDTPHEVILEHLFAAPFLAEKRMVVLEHLCAKGPQETKEFLGERVAEGTLPSTTVIVIWEEVNEVKKDALFEMLKKEKYASAFLQLEGAAFARWIADELKEAGARYDAGVPERVAACVETSEEAAHLIHQLSAFVGTARAIIREDVGKFVDEKIEDNIFALVDAIGSRNKKEAMLLLQEQWRQGVNDQYLFAMLTRQFRLLASVAAAKEANLALSSAEIATALHLHPFVVKKTMALLSRYTESELAQIYAELVEMDMAAKTSRAEMPLLMTTFIGRL